MQVHVYLDEAGDSLIVEIPSADGNLKTSVAFEDVHDSNREHPVVGQMPEPTATTIYAKPIGEMPLKVQEEYSKRVQEEQAQAQEQAARLQDPSVGDPGSEGAREPAADANVQLGAVDPVVLDSTEGDDPKGAVSGSKSGNKPSGASKR